MKGDFEVITLKEAFKLCRIDDGEIVRLRDSGSRDLISARPLTGREVRNRYDMKNTFVTEIAPRFIGGNYEGFLFIIRKTMHPHPAGRGNGKHSGLPV